ncbi:DUF3137 domain-containing protein [Croceicoccus sp. Ery15]|uniref:DUF3137 domain-containing protein n=1 Tax=Croceicoccus sp. Ery15 TaxID=1703338 RepID=UPI001E43941D|nr:DUF3137 domain-containing protein [Croceicoccus sp. Ery15]
MIELPQAQSLMAGPLGGWLQQQKDMRSEAQAESHRRMWKAAIVLGPVLIFAWIAIPAPMQLKAVVTGMVFIAATAWTRRPIAEARKSVKDGINRAIAQSLGLSFTIDSLPGTGFRRAKALGMVPRHDRARFEDHWSGEIAGHHFELHEAKLEEKRGSGKNRRWVTVFRGAIITMQYGRGIHSRTLLLREGKHRGFFGGRKDAVKLDGERFESVPIVHPEFEDAFDAWTTDPVEARYLIHPSYVERLLEIENSFAGKDICALFDGRHERGDLVIAVKTGNMFESGHMNAAMDEQMVARTIEQFGTLARLAETMNEFR